MPYPGSTTFPGVNTYPGTDSPTPPVGSAYWDFGADGSSGRVTVTNDGNADMMPTFTVSGGTAGGFIVTDVTTGDVVELSRYIPVGSLVTVNQRTGSVTIDNGADISAFLTSYGFFSIPSGETHVIQFSPIGAVTGDPQMTVYAQSTDL